MTSNPTPTSSEAAVAPRSAGDSSSSTTTLTHHFPYWGVYLHPCVFRAQATGRDIFWSMTHNGVLRLLSERYDSETSSSMIINKNKNINTNSGDFSRHRQVFFDALRYAQPQLVDFDYEIFAASEHSQTQKTLLHSKDGIAIQMRSSKLNNIESVVSRPATEQQPAAAASGLTYSLDPLRGDAHARERDNRVAQVLALGDSKFNAVAESLQNCLYSSRLCSNQALLHGFEADASSTSASCGTVEHQVLAAAPGGGGLVPSCLIPGLELALMSLHDGEEGTFFIAPSQTYANALPYIQDIPQHSQNNRKRNSAERQQAVAAPLLSTSADSDDTEEESKKGRDTEIRVGGGVGGDGHGLGEPLLDTALLPSSSETFSSRCASAGTVSSSPLPTLTDLDQDDLDGAVGDDTLLIAESPAAPPLDSTNFSSGKPRRSSSSQPTSMPTNTSHSINSNDRHLIQYGAKRVLCVRVLLRRRLPLVAPWPSVRVLSQYHIVKGDADDDGRGGGISSSRRNPWLCFIKGLITGCTPRLAAVNTPPWLPRIAVDAMGQDAIILALRAAWATAIVYAFGPASIASDCGVSVGGGCDLSPKVHTILDAAESALSAIECGAALKTAPDVTDMPDSVDFFLSHTPHAHSQVSFTITEDDPFLRTHISPAARQHVFRNVPFGSLTVPLWVDASLQCMRPSTTSAVLYHEGDPGDVEVSVTRRILKGVREDALAGLSATEPFLQIYLRSIVEKCSAHRRRSSSGKREASGEGGHSAACEDEGSQEESALDSSASDSRSSTTDSTFKSVPDDSKNNNNSSSNNNNNSSSSMNNFATHDGSCARRRDMLVPPVGLRRTEQRCFLRLDSHQPKLDYSDFFCSVLSSSSSSPQGRASLSARPLETAERTLADACLLLRLYDGTRFALPNDSSSGSGSGSDIDERNNVDGRESGSTPGHHSGSRERWLELQGIASLSKPCSTNAASRARLIQLLFPTESDSETGRHAAEESDEPRVVLAAASEAAYFSTRTPHTPCVRQRVLRQRLLGKIIHALYFCILTLSMGVPEVLTAVATTVSDEDENDSVDHTLCTLWRRRRAIMGQCFFLVALAYVELEGFCNHAREACAAALYYTPENAMIWALRASQGACMGLTKAAVSDMEVALRIIDSELHQLESGKACVDGQQVDLQSRLRVCQRQKTYLQQQMLNLQHEAEHERH